LLSIAQAFRRQWVRMIILWLGIFHCGTNFVKI
jgi:hypothetical protein